MKLDNIKLFNFRQYYGEQRLSFARSPKCNITVVNGKNGAGKTSLFVAINWCLYGEGAEGIGELLSKEAVARAQPGEEIEARVDLTFTHNGEKYISSRSLIGTKAKDGTVTTQRDPTHRLVRIGVDGQANEVPNPVGVINSILPSNVRRFFLFDGERIDHFSRPESADEVREAIRLVLRLEVLERGKRHLEDLAAQWRRQLKKSSSGQLSRLLELYEKKQQELEKAKSERERLSREIASAKRQKQQIESRLKALESVSALQAKREDREEALKIAQNDIADLRARIRLLSNEGHILFAQSAIKAALDILDEKRKRGEIPSGFRQQFLKDLLAQGICVCGRRFEKGDSAHKHLTSLLVGSVPDGLQDKVLETNVALVTIQGRIPIFLRELDQAMKQKVQLADYIDELEKHIDDLTRQLEDAPAEDARKLETERQKREQDIESFLIEKGRADSIAEGREKELRDLDSQIAKAEKREKRDELLAKKASLAQESANAIAEMYQQFAEDMRARIEEHTRKIFKKLVWKESHFQDIRLGTDYDLHVVDRYGLEAKPELSAGERQVLSLSFLLAMVEVAGEEAPIVMDTPFARLSSEPRNNIARNLPQLAPQIVLLVTDEELRDEERHLLSQRVGYEYDLDFDLMTSCTSIEKARP